MCRLSTFEVQSGAKQEFQILCFAQKHFVPLRGSEQLQNRKEDISIRMDALDESRHQIYKRRYPHKPALMLLKIIEENEIRVSYYKEGSIFYEPNYERWKEATEILIGKGYTVNQVTEMKETFQRELASVTKAKRELRKEENLINDIIDGNNRVQIAEKIVPMLEAKENTKETDSIQNEISAEKKTLRKGGDAERTELITAEIPAHTDEDYLENRPAHNAYCAPQRPLLRSKTAVGLCIYILDPPIMGLCLIQR